MKREKALTAKNATITQKGGLSGVARDVSRRLYSPPSPPLPAPTFKKTQMVSRDLVSYERGCPRNGR